MIFVQASNLCNMHLIYNISNWRPVELKRSRVVLEYAYHHTHASAMGSHVSILTPLCAPIPSQSELDSYQSTIEEILDPMCALNSHTKKGPRRDLPVQSVCYRFSWPRRSVLSRSQLSPGACGFCVPCWIRPKPCGRDLRSLPGWSCWSNQPRSHRR